MPMLGAATGSTKKSYSGVVKSGTKSVIVIKLWNEEEENSSEITKRDIKNKIDISKLGIGITKMRKVTEEAVVECENKSQADKSKEEVTKKRGRKYIIQAPKKKLMIKILDVG